MSRFQEGGSEEVDHSLVAFADEEPAQAEPASDEDASTRSAGEEAAGGASVDTPSSAPEDESAAGIVAGDATRQTRGSTASARPRRRRRPGTGLIGNGKT